MATRRAENAPDQAKQEIFSGKLEFHSKLALQIAPEDFISGNHQTNNTKACRKGVRMSALKVNLLPIKKVMT
jgi:hypothetical protein